MRDKLIVILLGCLFACPFATTAFGQASESQPPQFRLPSTAAPERYKVTLTIAPDKDTFTGSIDIDVNFKQASSVLWLNAERLTVKDATLVSGGQPASARVIPEPKDFVGFSFDHAVGPGTAKLHVNYEGQISRKDEAGLFQAKDADHWYVYSQFESISARRAFPCFDEPGYKVPWQITLTVPSEDDAFSNTPPLAEKSADAGMKTVEFAETRPLPSYLVAIAVGPFEIVDAGHAGAKNTAIRIIVPQGHSAEAQYVAKATPEIVNLLEKYFGIPYPYPKLDEVAVPLFGGAMENAGLVTYGSSFFLMKPDAPLGVKRTATSVIAHELAHQWFGDLVTTAWWDDIWLNEGFASWMANKIVNEYHPEWKDNINEINSYQRAMGTDELVSSRKVRQPILGNDDIENAFDGITYNKGSSLLNMFESYQGKEKFQQGIQRYLAKYSWKNATSADFLASVSGDNPAIAKAFSSFLDQAGVPLVSAKLECAGGAAKLQLSQERLLPLGSQGNADQLWGIPTCVKYDSGSSETRECTLLTGKSATLALTKAQGCPAWTYANADEAGYYRVLYEKPALEALSKNAKQLTVEERVGFLGDVAALTHGHMPLGDALVLVPKFSSDSPEVVSKTIGLVGGLDDHLVTDQLKPHYRRYLTDVYKQRSEELGWKDKPQENPRERQLRPQLLDLMTNHAEDAEFMEQAKKLAAAWLDDHSAVDQDVLGVVLNGAAAHGDRALFNRLREDAKKETNEQVQSTVLRAMGHFRDPEVLKSAMALALGGDFDVRQSLFFIVVTAAGSPTDRDAAYDFVKQNWDALIAKLPTDFGAFMPRVAAGFCDAQHRTDAEAFFTGRSTKFAGGPRTLAQTLEGITICEANKNANQASVSEFLSRY